MSPFYIQGTQININNLHIVDYLGFLTHLVVDILRHNVQDTVSKVTGRVDPNKDEKR